jgi:HAE1 family hydrophobic/amphiphilic exporter-1
MWLTRVSIERRVTTIMIMIGIMVLGLAGLSRMPWDQFPQIELPYIFVTVPYPGAGPEEVEQGVVKPVEDAVSVITGVQKVESTCQENVGSVQIEFRYGTNLDAAASDVRDALDRAKALFPEDAKDPQLFKLNISAMPVMIIGITGERSPRELYRIVEDRIEPRLSQVPGTASVTVTGGEQREIQIRVRKERLDAVGMSLSQFAQYLAASNLKLPAGNLKVGSRDYTVRLLGEFATMEEIRRLDVPTPAGGTVPLATLAEVLDTSAEASTISRINQQPAVMISILKTSEANTVAVCDGARRELERLVGTDGKPGILPRDIKATISRDGSDRVRKSIHGVLEHLLLGGVFAGIVVFLFLHDIRATTIVCLTMPVAIIAAFAPVGLGFKFTLNMLVLMGFLVAIGAVVDDAVVVIENIHRHLETGEPPSSAALNGRVEIGSAAVAITLVDVVVFIPIALMGGIVGQIFYPFGLTVACTVLFSLFVCFTLVPSLSGWWFIRRDRRPTQLSAVGRVFQRLFDLWDRGFEGLRSAYRRLLRVAITHAYLTAIIAYALLAVVLFGLFPRLGFGMTPVVDSGTVNIDVESSPGTRLEYTDRIVRTIEQRLMDKNKYPEIEYLSATVGSLGGGMMGGSGSGGQYGNILITMYGRRERLRAHQRSDQQLAADLRVALADIPGATIRVAVTEARGGRGAEAPVQVHLLSSDLALLNRKAQEIRQKMAEIPGLLYVDTSSKPGRPEIRAIVDRSRLAQYGLVLADVAGNLRTGFAGATGTKFREAGDEYDIRVEFSESDKARVSDVADAVVGVTHTGQIVRLQDIATIQMAAGPSLIERADRERKVTVSAYIDPAVTNMRVVEAAVNGIIQGTDLGAVTWRWAGEAQMRQESFGRMGGALLLSIVLIYVLAAALYNSLLEPYNILLNLPVAMVGAVLGLLLARMQLTIVSILGIIMLMGIVGKNSILIVDFTNTLRARGRSRFDALMEAGPLRMKPVLMTTVITIAVLTPMALGRSEGSEFRAPLAVAVIFGLALATLVSLVLVPSTYVIWDNLSGFFTRLGRAVFSRGRGRSGGPAAVALGDPDVGDSPEPRAGADEEDSNGGQ